MLKRLTLTAVGVAVLAGSISADKISRAGAFLAKSATTGPTI